MKIDEQGFAYREQPGDLRTHPPGSLDSFGVPWDRTLPLTPLGLIPPDESHEERRARIRAHYPLSIAQRLDNVGLFGSRARAEKEEPIIREEIKKEDAIFFRLRPPADLSPAKRRRMLCELAKEPPAD